MTAGDSKAALTITLQPALAPSPQPRPAPTARALPPGLVAQVGQNWTPIMGQNWMPIDTEQRTFRYRLLDTTRTYGQDKLEESGEASPQRRRHAQRVLQVCRASSSVTGALSKADA